MKFGVNISSAHSTVEAFAYMKVRQVQNNDVITGRSHRFGFLNQASASCIWLAES